MEPEVSLQGSRKSVNSPPLPMYWDLITVFFMLSISIFRSCGTIRRHTG